MNRETIVGIVGLTIIASFLITIDTLRRKNYLTRDILLYAKFESVGNLLPTQPVRINGNDVGKVLRIFKHNEADKWIIVEAKIEKGTQIPKNAVAYVLDGSGIGLSAGELNIEYSGVCDGDACVQRGDTIKGRGKLYTDIMSASTIAAIDPIVAKLGNMDSITLMIEGMRKTMDNANRSLLKLSPDMRKMLVDAKNTTGGFAGQNQKISALLDSLSAMTGHIKGQDFGKVVKDAHTSISKIGNQIAGLEPTLQKADGAVAKINTSLDKLMENAQFKKLMNDPASVDSLQAQIRKIDVLLEDIRINPKKYLKLGKKGNIKEVE